eukprot:maker-scaffold_7-snap-gene-12.46-mRNA-1 protein AED:0.00 eAED:0.00 QI:131/1/1/1/1/1/2/421/409
MSKAMKVNLRCVNPADKATVPESLDVESTTTIGTIKAAINDSNEVPIDQQKLIYKGKVLSNNEATLEGVRFTNGDTFVYLRSKKKKKPVETSSSETVSYSLPAGTASTTPASNQSNQGTTGSAPANPFGGFNPASMIGGAQPNMAMMQQMMQNPAFRNMMLDPNMLQLAMGQMQNSPQMQRLFEQFPEARQMMSNPEFFREQMEAMLDPNRRAEVTRQQDQLLNRLNTMPGGMSAMARAYHATNDLRENINNPEQETSDPPLSTQDSNDDENNNPWGTGRRPNTQTQAPPQGQSNMNNMEQMFRNMLFNPGAAPGAGQSVPSAGQNPFAQGMADPNFMQNMMNMAQMFNQGSAFGASPVQTDSRPPEERFASQLQRLQDMGFPNREANLAALQASNGNLDMAIDRLLGN